MKWVCHVIKVTIFPILSTSQVAEMVKNLPAMQEIWVQSLGWEDPLEEGVATHSSILVYRIPWTEEPGPWGGKESGTTEWLTYTQKLLWCRLGFPSPSLIVSFIDSLLFMLVPGLGCFPVIQHLLLPKPHLPNNKAWHNGHHIHKFASLTSVYTLCPRAQYMYLYTWIYLHYLIT